MTSGERRAAIAAAAVLAAVALSGCGGDDGDTTYAAGVSRPIAKVQFLREADRICASTNARIEAAGDDLIGGRSDPPPAEVKRVVIGVAIPALEAEVRAIRALGAPKGDERGGRGDRRRDRGRDRRDPRRPGRGRRPRAAGGAAPRGAAVARLRLAGMRAAVSPGSGRLSVDATDSAMTDELDRRWRVQRAADRGGVPRAGQRDLQRRQQGARPGAGRRRRQR